MGSETRARLGLAALLVATLFCFEILFAQGTYAGPALLGMAIASGVAMLGRRLGLPASLTVVVSVSLLVMYVAYIFETDATFYGLPTRAALSALGASLARAQETSVVDFAPIPSRPGYVILVVGAMWMATTIGEIATFRWRRPFVASVPSIALFAFLLIVGATSAATFFVLVFLAALLSYWGLESAHRLRSWGRWMSPFTAERDEATSVTGRLARRMGALCLTAAVIGPFFLPALGDGVLAWRNRTGEGPGGGGSGGNVDLLVSLQPEFLRQSDRELFTVRADEAGYWRLTSLIEFDGETWRPNDDLDVSLAALEREQPPGEPLSQEFALIGLEGEYLPAAAEPVAVDFEDDVPGGLITDPENHDLRVASGVEGLVYRVESVVPDATYAQLRRDEAGELTNDEYTEVDGDLSAEVRTLLERWTAGRRSDLAKLVAIQQRLQTFTYDTDVPPRASKDYLTEFLTEVRAGYCQQFATAFALLSRAQGFPTRVSVGFLPGAPSQDGDGYVVRGTHAHAWPEVYFERHGWIRFEPTPRGTATAIPSYTAPPVGTPQEIRGALGERPVRGGELDTDEERLERVQRPGPAGFVAPVAPIDDRWRKTFGDLALAVAIVLGAFVVITPALKEVVAALRYRRARTPAELASAAFRHFEDEAAELASPRSRSESAVAFARRIAALGRVSESAAVRLATLHEAATYGGGSMPAEDAQEARRAARGLRSAMWARAPWSTRFIRLFSVRRLASRAVARLRALAPRRIRPATT